MTDTESGPATPEMSRFVPFTPIERWSVVVAVVVTVVLRFVTHSPLWLDEALSVHIAELPVGDLLEALRHDGHPPLYYLLLHGWMSVFGDGDLAVRALSGLASVATLPLAYAAGRRRGGPTVGWAVLLLTAVTPFSLRYATETRMYAVVMLLVFAAWLLADDLRRRPEASALGQLGGRHRISAVDPLLGLLSRRGRGRRTRLALVASRCS